MGIARAAAILAVAQVLTTGCAKRNAPYRFRGPLVSSVRADDVSDRSARGPSDPTDDLDVDDPRPRPGDSVDASRSRVGSRSATSPLMTEKRARLGGSLADTLRRLVGERRRDQTQVQFVTEALSAIGARIDSTLRATETGDALLTAARERRATTTDVAPLLGDIAVFERVYRKEPNSILGVVIAADPRGTVEFVYLARGVVRRGFVNLSHRDAKRDQNGRVLNTILRQKDGHGKKGRGDLTGVLFSTYLRLDRLGS